MDQAREHRPINSKKTIKSMLNDGYIKKRALTQKWKPIRGWKQSYLTKANKGNAAYSK